MVTTSVKTTLSRDMLAGVGFGSEGIFRRVQMNRLGEAAIQLIRARVARGIGSDDQPMPALKRGKVIQFAGRVDGRATFRNIGYAGYKTKKGLQPIRDLYGDGSQGGHMLDNISVRAADESSVRIAITARKARTKALANEKRTPWFSFSDADQQALRDMAADMFGDAVRQVSNRFTAYRRAA